MQNISSTTAGKSGAISIRQFFVTLTDQPDSKLLPGVSAGVLFTFSEFENAEHNSSDSPVSREAFAWSSDPYEEVVPLLLAGTAADGEIVELYGDTKKRPNGKKYF